MKKQILTFTLSALLLVSIAMISQSFSRPFKKVHGHKSLAWKDTLHDFGKVKIGPELVYKFTFKNKSSKPVTIKTAEPGCSCTVSEFSHEPIAKNKSGYVTAKYNTAGRMGFFKKFIKVTFEDGGVQELVITGDVINP